MALPLALAAAVVTGIAGASLVSVSVLEGTTGQDIAPGGPTNPDESLLDQLSDATNGFNIPWFAIGGFVAFIIVLRTFVETATEELL